MDKGLVFWIIYLVALILWCVGLGGAVGPNWGFSRGGLILFVLIFLLGWGVYGFVIH